jgi:hypothetical protein
MAGATGVTIVLRTSRRVRVEVLQEDGKPVAGATVVAMPRGDDVSMRDRRPTATTDAEGVAWLTGLDPDRRYALSVEPPAGRQDLFRAQAREIESDRATVRLEQGFMIRGVVRNGAGEPFPEARVSCRPERGTRKLVQADAEGRFVVGPLRRGEVAFRAWDPDAALARERVPETVVDASVGEVTLVADSGLEVIVKVPRVGPHESLYGTVVFEGTGKTVRRHSFGGRIRIAGLTENDRITLFIGPLGDGHCLLRRGLVPGAGEIEAEFVPGKTITGRVLAPEGATKTGAFAMVFGNRINARAGEDGRLVIRGLPDGRGRSTAGRRRRTGSASAASRSRPAPRSSWICETSDGTIGRMGKTTIALLLLAVTGLSAGAGEDDELPTVCLVVQVVDDKTAEPIPGARARVYRDATCGERLGEATADADGICRIEGMTPGAGVALRVDEPGRRFALETFVVPCAPRTSRVSMGSPIRLRGVVLDAATDRPIEGATVIAQAGTLEPGWRRTDVVHGPIRATASTERRGRFTLPDAGRLVRIRAEGYAASLFYVQGRWRDLSDLRFRLIPSGVVRGRVLDPRAGRWSAHACSPPRAGGSTRSRDRLEACCRTSTRGRSWTSRPCRGPDRRERGVFPGAFLRDALLRPLGRRATGHVRLVARVGAARLDRAPGPRLRPTTTCGPPASSPAAPFGTGEHVATDRNLHTSRPGSRRERQPRPGGRDRDVAPVLRRGPSPGGRSVPPDHPAPGQGPIRDRGSGIHPGDRQARGRRDRGGTSGSSVSFAWRSRSCSLPDTPLRRTCGWQPFREREGTGPNRSSGRPTGRCGWTSIRRPGRCGSAPPDSSR